MFNILKEKINKFKVCDLFLLRLMLINKILIVISRLLAALAVLFCFGYCYFS
ncbi:MAG: hypothetical protein ACI9L6_001466 [Flavobacterium sp.]|jgi:hypothetical protein